jgi:hypothetical protein
MLSHVYAGGRGKTPEEDDGKEESEKVKDVFCLCIYRIVFNVV